MERTIYYEAAKAITTRLRNEVNGYVKYELYPEIDTVIFKISFKEFNFNYAINEIQDLMISDGFGEAVDMLLSKYRKAVLNAFFKTEARKERDRMEAYV